MTVWYRKDRTQWRQHENCLEIIVGLLRLTILGLLMKWCTFDICSWHRRSWKSLMDRPIWVKSPLVTAINVYMCIVDDTLSGWDSLVYIAANTITEQDNRYVIRFYVGCAKIFFRKKRHPQESWLVESIIWHIYSWAMDLDEIFDWYSENWVKSGSNYDRYMPSRNIGTGVLINHIALAFGYPFTLAIKCHNFNSLDLAGRDCNVRLVILTVYQR